MCISQYISCSRMSKTELPIFLFLFNSPEHIFENSREDNCLYNLSHPVFLPPSHTKWFMNAIITQASAFWDLLRYFYIAHTKIICTITFWQTIFNHTVHSVCIINLSICNTICLLVDLETIYHNNESWCQGDHRTAIYCSILIVTLVLLIHNLSVVTWAHCIRT